MKRWSWSAVGLGLGLCLGWVACGENPPPAEGCEATASCDGNRGGGPNIDPPRTPPDDAGTPPGNGDAGTPPGNGDAGTPPGNDAGTPPNNGGNPPPSGAVGETLWLSHDALEQQEFAASVAASSDGQAIYTASMRGETRQGAFVGGPNAALIVRRYSVSGKPQWEESFALWADDGSRSAAVSGRVLLSVSPTGDVYMLADVRGGRMEMNAGLFPGVTLVKLTSSGELKWSNSFAFSAQFHQALALVADRQGGVFVSTRATQAYDSTLQCAPTEGALYRVGTEGSVQWRKRLGEPQCGERAADAWGLAAQPDGGVALAGSFSGTLETPVGRATTPNESPFFATLTAQGEWGWLKTFPQSHGRVTSLGSSAKGTVVGAGVLWGGGFTWGADALGQVPSFLFVAEADGAPRWAKSLGRSEMPVIAVEPAGRVAVAGLSRDFPTPAPGGTDATQNPQLFARRYNLAGKLLWNRFFKRSGGSTGFTDQVVSAAPSGEGSGNTLLFGQFSQSEDFGTGVRTPKGTDLFLLKLGAGPEF